MRVRFSLAILGLLAGPASAGDLAAYEPVGFSPDGTLFAFMESGIMDGSGAPYLNAYAIEIPTDSWVSGTPVRLGGGEPGDLTDAQMRARLAGMRAEARVLLADASANADWRPGALLALSPPTDLEGDGTRMTVNPRYLPAVVSDGALTAMLETIPFPDGTNGCPEGMGAIAGFRLTLEDGHSLVTLNEDADVPSSRGCPTGYRIAGVETHHASDGTRSVVVLVNVFSIGFEGPDVRWLAVAQRGALSEQANQSEQAN